MNGNGVIESLHVLQLLHDPPSELSISRRNPCPQLRELASRVQVTVLLVVDDDATVAVQCLVPQSPDLHGVSPKAGRNSWLAGSEGPPDFPIDADVVRFNHIDGPGKQPVIVPAKSAGGLSTH